MATYTLIQRTILSSTTATISFTSIPQTYTDLVFVLSSRQNTYNYGGFYMKFNGSTAGTNVTAKRLMGNSGVSSSTSTEMTWVGSTAAGFTADTFASGQIYIPNYTSSNNKSASFEGAQESNISGVTSILTAWLWSQTAAITQVDFGTFDSGFSDAFVQYSSISLYGISKA
jgi:hypothetical protein